MNRTCTILLFLLTTAMSISCQTDKRRSVEVVVRDLSGKSPVGIVTVDNTAIPIMPYANASGLFFPQPGDQISIRGNYFWTGAAFDLQEVISKSGHKPSQNLLTILILPEMKVITQWSTSGQKNDVDHLLLQEYAQVIPVIVRSKDDNLDLRPIIKQSMFSYRFLRYVAPKGSPCSYRGWISLTDPEDEIRFGYHLDDDRPFDGWKVSLNRNTILPNKPQDLILVFELDIRNHQVSVFHLLLSANRDLLELGVCSQERMKDTPPVVTLNMEPAMAYRPKMIHTAYEETFVDLR